MPFDSDWCTSVRRWRCWCCWADSLSSPLPSPTARRSSESRSPRSSPKNTSMISRATCRHRQLAVGMISARQIGRNRTYIASRSRMRRCRWASTFPPDIPMDRVARAPRDNSVLVVRRYCLNIRSDRSAPPYQRTGCCANRAYCRNRSAGPRRRSPAPAAFDCPPQLRLPACRLDHPRDPSRTSSD